MPGNSQLHIHTKVAIVLTDQCARCWRNRYESPSLVRRAESRALGDAREPHSFPSPDSTPSPFRLQPDVWPYWSRWIHLDTASVQGQGREIVTQTFPALRRPLRCHIGGNWMIKWSIFKTFQSKTREMEEERERKEEGTGPVSPQEGTGNCPLYRETFFPWVYLSRLIRIYRVYHHKPKHSSLFSAEKWRALPLLSASKFPEQWCSVLESVTSLAPFPDPQGTLGSIAKVGNDGKPKKMAAKGW